MAFILLLIFSNFFMIIPFNNFSPYPFCYTSRMAVMAMLIPLYYDI
jgi:hypothetical protein